MQNKMVKTILIIFVVISLIILVRFYMLGNMSKTGKAPGLVAGRLSACSDKPNCVSSEISDDPSHYISPLRYSASMSDCSDRQKNTVSNTVMESLAGCVF